MTAVTTAIGRVSAVATKIFAAGQQQGAAICDRGTGKYRSAGYRQSGKRSARGFKCGR
jgi:hypothetical protein